MKTTLRWLAAATLVTALSSCGNGGGGPTSTVAPVVEDWNFPPGGTEKTLVIIASNDSLRVGDSFEVKTVVYNISGLYGSTVKLEYDPTRIAVDQVLGGPECFGPAPVFVGMASVPERLVSFGATRTDTSGVFSGSGVFFKLKCRALAAGSSRFRIRRQDVTLVDRHGTVLPDLNAMRQTDVTLEILP